jgi:uncharacterized protein YhdP
LPLSALVVRLPMVQRVGGTATADLHVRGTLPAPEIRGTVDSSDGTVTLAGIAAPFEDLQGTVELAHKREILRSVRGKLAGGSVAATGDVSRSGDEWNFQLSLQTEGNRAEQILGGRTGGSEVTGAVSLTGTLTSQGRDGEGFVPNLGGNLKLAMSDGYFGRQTLTVRMLSLMNVAGLLGPEKSGVLGSQVPYRRLTGDITIEQGVARTENLLLETPAFDLSAVGQVDLSNQLIEMDVAVKPLQTADKLITTIPLVGWVLGGKDGALIAAFYRVTGPLDEPKVTSLPLKSIGRNAFGIFRRLLELPEAVTGP